MLAELQVQLFRDGVDHVAMHALYRTAGRARVASSSEHGCDAADIDIIL